MKNKFKLVLSFMLSAVFALALTLGVANVNVAKAADGDATEAVTLDHDLSAYLALADKGTNGDYKEAALFRIKSSTDPHATGWNVKNICLNEGGKEALFSAIKFNGKTLTEIRNEYLAIIKAGGDCPITWTNMPDNGDAYPHTMQANICTEVIDNNSKAVEERYARYAPIFANVTNHNADLKSGIDFYVPNILFAEGGLLEGGISTIEITTDFVITDNDGEVWGLSKNVLFGDVQGKMTYKKVGEPANKVATNVLMIDGTPGASDSFLSFYIDNSDYKDLSTAGYSIDLGSGAKLNEFGLDKTYLASLDFYKFIKIDGVSMYDLMTEHANEQIINVWGRSTNYSNSFGIRWPAGVTAPDDVQKIEILAGCQFPSYSDPLNTVYVVEEDTVLNVAADGRFYSEEVVLTADDVTISDARVDGAAGELLLVDIAIAPFKYGDRDAYDVNYFGKDYTLFRESIYLNGVSLFEINNTHDDSGYEYVTSPMDNAAQSGGKDLFANPTMIKAEGNTITVHIFRQYLEDILNNGDDLTVTVDFKLENLSVGSGGGYRNLAQLYTKEAASKVVYSVPFDVTINGETIKVAKGAKVERPADPTKEATVDKTYTFVGWTVNDMPYDFEAPVTSDLVIEAEWTEAARMYNLTMSFVGVEGMPEQAGQIPYGTPMNFSEIAADLVIEGYDHVVTVNGTEIDPETYVHTVEGDVAIVVTYTVIEQGGGDVEDDSEVESTPVEDDSEVESTPVEDDSEVESEEAPVESEETPVESEEAPAESVETPAESVEAPATSEKESAPAEEEGGCMGAIGSTAGMLVAMLGAVVIIRKKRA